MPDISQSTWSESDAANTATPPDGWPENQAPSTVNDCARMMMGAIKRFWSRVNPAAASTGAANAYVLTPAAALGAYATGEAYAFRATLANTGAATLNISALGAKAIKKYVGGAKADLSAGDIAAGQPVQLAYDGADMVLMSAGAAPGLDGYLHGLTLANSAGDPANDIDVAPGRAWSEAAAGGMMVLGAALTKRLDAAWAVGSGQGGLDTGSKANATWYHLHLIRRPDTGVVDALFSTSAGAPSLPSGYSQRRRIGAVRTDGAGAILAFTQLADEFLWKTPVLDVNVSNLGTSAVSYTLSTPAGVQVWGILVGFVHHANPNTIAYMSSIDVNDVAATGAVFTCNSQVAGQGASWAARVRTNLSSQIRARASAAATSVGIQTQGWMDLRGRV